MKRAAATRRGSLLLLAVLFTLLNAFKPLHVDDAAYYYYARQAATDPLDPYGFAIFWYDQPEPANEVLAPPVLPYWWSLALRVTQEPVLWKLWLFPFSLCLVVALHGLFRRFCGRLALLLTWLTVLSPALLPGFNLMLDVPALALGLGSLLLFIRGVDGTPPPTPSPKRRGGAGKRGSCLSAPPLRFGEGVGGWGCCASALAGVMAGLAMQTKYTALLAPAAMFLYALSHGRLRWWPLALLPALALFAAWEAFVAHRYGQSHFLYHLTHGRDSLLQRGYLLPLLFSLTGTVAPAVLLLGLCALRVRTAFVLTAAALIALGFAAVALVELRFHGELTPAAVLFGPSRPRAGTSRWPKSFSACAGWPWRLSLASAPGGCAGWGGDRGAGGRTTASSFCGWGWRWLVSLPCRRFPRSGAYSA